MPWFNGNTGEFMGLHGNSRGLIGDYAEHADHADVGLQLAQPWVVDSARYENTLVGTPYLDGQ